MKDTALQLDLSINLTTIIGVVVWIVTLTIAWTKFGGRLDLLELRVDNIEKAITSISESLKMFTSNQTQLAVIGAEIAAIQTSYAALHQTVEQMRVGEGFIAGPRRGNIQGEYPSRIIGAGS